MNYFLTKETDKLLPKETKSFPDYLRLKNNLQSKLISFYKNKFY